MEIVPSGQVRGASVEGLDLRSSPSAEETETLVQALGEYGVLRFPKQTLSAGQLRDFAAAVRASLAKPQTGARLAALGAITQASSPEEFTGWLKQDAERWARVIKAAGVKEE